VVNIPAKERIFRQKMVLLKTEISTYVDLPNDTLIMTHLGSCYAPVGSLPSGVIAGIKEGKK
jgi:hypothetical protein